MSSAVVPATVYTVVVNPVSETTVVIQPTQSTVVVDNSRPGIQGIQGPPGDVGEPGPQGPIGPSGVATPNLYSTYSWSNVHTFNLGIGLGYSTSIYEYFGINAKLAGSGQFRVLNQSSGTLFSVASNGEIYAPGLSGSVGATGPAGPTGPQGPTGPAGSDATVNVNAQYTFTNTVSFLAGGNAIFNSLTANTLTSTYDASVGRNLTVTGNLTILGTSVSLQGQSTAFTDNLILLNNGIETTITNVVGDGEAIVFTSNNNYSATWNVLVTGITPSSFNGSYTIFYANATHFVVNGSNIDTYVSGGSARGHSSQNPDIGLAAGYNDGTYHHTGIFRDASDGYWKVFDNYAPEPDAVVNIDTANDTFHIANFWANTTRIGNTSVYSTINATSFSGVANSAAYFGGQSPSYYANTSEPANAYTNAVSYVDGKSFANTLQLSSNLSNYQTTSGLAANVAILSANSSSYVVSPIRVISANVTVLANDSILLANSTANIVMTMPWASSVPGRPYEIKNINTGAVTLVGSGTDKIDGYNNMIIQFKNSMIGLRSTGSGWIVY